jgi:hypothetical protein
VNNSIESQSVEEALDYVIPSCGLREEDWFGF